ncbi:MAG: hypothetical protein ACREPB_03385 [Arenimonas sp.]
MKISIEHRDRLLLIAALQLLSKQQMDTPSDTPRIKRLIHNLQLEMKVPLPDPSHSMVSELQRLTKEQSQSFDPEREKSLQRMLHRLQYEVELPALDPNPDKRGELMIGDGVLYKGVLHEVVHETWDVLIAPFDDDGGETWPWPWVPQADLTFPQVIASDLPTFQPPKAAQALSLVA